MGRSANSKSTNFLAAGPQVVYPIGLKGHDEPIITILPELLDIGISLIANKHVYLGIDIPHPQWRNQTKRYHLLVRSPPS